MIDAWVDSFVPHYAEVVKTFIRGHANPPSTQCWSRRIWRLTEKRDYIKVTLRQRIAEMNAAGHINSEWRNRLS